MTGICVGDTTSEDHVTIKYDTGGNQLWASTYNGEANGWDEASSIAVDSLGNVYVTGSSSGGGYSTINTIKYTGDGNELWVATNSNGDDGIAITLDDSLVFIRRADPIISFSGFVPPVLPQEQSSHAELTG